jgi:hypothetical protein
MAWVLMAVALSLRSGFRLRVSVLCVQRTRGVKRPRTYRENARESRGWRSQQQKESIRSLPGNLQESGETSRELPLPQCVPFKRMFL